LRTPSAATRSTARSRRPSFGASPTSQWVRSPTVAAIPAIPWSSGMSSAEAPTSIHRYAELTWPEVAAWAERDPVLVMPVATLEDHGHHLPIDTDVVIAETLAERAVRARPGRAL